MDLTTSAPTSVFQPLRVKIPEMLQAEIGKLAPWSVRVLLGPSCAGPSGWGWEVKATAGPQAGSRLGRACCPHSPTAGLGRQLCLAVPRSLRSTSETWPEVSLSRPKLKGESNLWGPERPRGLCTTCLLHVVQSGNRASPGLESPRCSHPQGPFV